MKNILSSLLVSLFLTTLHFSTAAAGQNEDLEKMFEERIRSVVAVEYFVQTEIDRQPFSALGLVADDSGLIVLQDHSILTWIAVDRLKQFKVRLLRGREEFDAEYLGEEPVNGWHFLRVSDEEFYEKVVPVTAYEIAEAKIGEQLWGFGAMDEDHDFEPFFLMGRFSLLRPLPLPFGFTMIPVTGPGSLVFNLSGDLVGWGTLSFLTDAMLYVQENQMPVAIRTSRESGIFIPIREVLPYLDQIPEDPNENLTPWAGAVQLQPVEQEVAKFLEIGDHGAVVLSEIVEGSPMDEAGLKRGDIVVAIDGEPIPHYRPHEMVTEHLRREVLKRGIGGKIGFSVLRVSEELEFEVTLGKQPQIFRHAAYRYFSEVGVTIREFLLFDGINRRVGSATDQGVIINFVRPNSPAATAGLHANDWVKEIDGVEISDYEEAIRLVEEAIEEEKSEIVFLTSRRNETSVVRVRLR